MWRCQVTNRALLERITRDPLVLSGKPIVRGTRISVELINSWIESGHSPEEIVEDYPGLTLDDIEAAVAYAADIRARTEVRPW